MKKKPIKINEIKEQTNQPLVSMSVSHRRLIFARNACYLIQHIQDILQVIPHKVLQLSSESLSSESLSLQSYKSPWSIQMLCKIDAARTVLLSVLVCCSTFFSLKRQRPLSVPNALSTTDLAALSFLLNSRSSGWRCPLFGYGLTSHFSSG